jgi:methyl-accepting chemotaxis protein
MHFLNQYRIGTRLGASFAGLLLLILAVAAVGAWQLRQVALSTTESSALDEQVKNIERWQGAVNLNLTRALGGGRFGLPPGHGGLPGAADEGNLGDITKLQDSVNASLTDPRDRALLEAVGTHRKTYVDVRAQSRRCLQGRQRRGRQPAGQRPDDGRCQGLPGRHRRPAKAAAGAGPCRRHAAGGHAPFRAGAGPAAGAGRAGGGAGRGLAWTITRSVTRRCSGDCHGAAHRRQGPVGAGGPRLRGDEIGALQRALGLMQSSLVEMVQQIRSGTTGVAAASAEIASASTDLSQRTEETSGSLQQTASAMEQITAT